MSKIIYDSLGREDLYLIQAFEDGYCYLVNTKLPTEDMTIKEYLKWKEQNLNNIICLNQPYTPQEFSNSYIQDYCSFISIINESAEIAQVDVEDFISPFIGGIIGFDFRELLKRLWVENANFWGCRRIIRNYYVELFTKG